MEDKNGFKIMRIMPECLTKEEKEALGRFCFRLKNSLGNNLVFVKLFGSKVRGDFNKDSDIDILLLLRKKSLKVREDVYDILFDIDPYYELRISPRIMSSYEYRKNAELHSPFIENVEKEGVRL